MCVRVPVPVPCMRYSTVPRLIVLCAIGEQLPQKLHIASKQVGRLCTTNRSETKPRHFQRNRPTQLAAIDDFVAAFRTLAARPAAGSYAKSEASQTQPIRPNVVCSFPKTAAATFSTPRPTGVSGASHEPAHVSGAT